MTWKQLIFSLSATLILPAQTPADTPPSEEVPLSEEESQLANASIFNEGMARTITVSIPAPRGLILDREGRPFAQTKMAYHLALDFTAYKGPVDIETATAWAQARVQEANILSNGDESYSDEKLGAYYKNRRWLPRIISQVITQGKAESLASNLPTGLSLLPVYLRHYPEKSSAAHLIGYVGAKTVLPTGPINDGDPLFKTTMGKSGFEKVFDDKLRGVPGLNKLIFDKDGNKILDDPIRAPRPGGNVITTIDLDWQLYAERVLREESKRSAFVVIDIQTGEVLVMASRPSYDLNEFVPYITNERYRELNEDPASPLFGRAFSSELPPASTFKPFVTLAGITSGAIHPYQKFNCPYEIEIGHLKMKNHSKGHNGWVGPKKALAISNNPWFYQVGIETGPQTFLSVARRAGFGSKTGLPLIGEKPGRAPSPEYIMQKMGRPTTDGDTANLAIGQGLMLATPLQVAQGMAAIGNGDILMDLQLVRQIQDFHGRVIEAPKPSKRNDLNLSSAALKQARSGMYDVVHAAYGTGKKGDLGFTLMCGKTGTAQWKPAIKQNLAWFSGFFPYNNPRYAFALVYEGVPGEGVSGGRNAAPLVRRFFRHFINDIEQNLKPDSRADLYAEKEETPEGRLKPAIPVALIIEDDEEGFTVPTPENTLEEDIPKAIAVDPREENSGAPAALPINPPIAPADTPREEPVAPADE